MKVEKLVIDKYNTFSGYGGDDSEVRVRGTVSIDGKRREFELETSEEEVFVELSSLAGRKSLNETLDWVAVTSDTAEQIISLILKKDEGLIYFLEEELITKLGYEY
tara:strand:- start:343 stop:660 length:318 start_codon:yes stop_codon:yes gene_type:complete